MKFAVALCLALFLTVTAFAEDRDPRSSVLDTDRDGLSDAFEQQILQKFSPAFFVSKQECDMFPSEWTAGGRDPRVLERNGTIYGQVSRRELKGRPGAFIEVHYYHLWSRDCGRMGHALDAEHVSALLEAVSFDQPVDGWKAVYWYAAAHEDTLCDASSGARGASLLAEYHGPVVWISRGKHGSFLTPEKCRFGCGGDRCDDVRALPFMPVINIGEPGVPMNGASWVNSDRWGLAGKMDSDFTDTIMARLEESKEGAVITLNSPPPPTKALILGSNSSFGAFMAGNGQAIRSVEAAASALGYSGKSFWIAAGYIRGWMRVKRR